jgi:hypothetical protein
MTDQTQNLLPLPTPPSIPEIELTFVPGKFEYIKPSSANYKAMLINAFQAVSHTHLWDFMKEYCESFMSSKDANVLIISNKMVELGYNGHSGCSFGCIMRDMQYIANYGEKKFMETYLRNISNTKSK